MGHVVDPRRKEAGRGREEEAKGSKEEDDKRQKGRKGEEDLDQEGEETAEGKDEDGREQPGASLQAGVAPPPDVDGNFEVRNYKVARRPMLPTKAEVDEHYVLRLQYRSWCKHCVAGKARSNQHATRDPEEERLGVTWSADYAFMGGEYNEQEEGMQAALIMYDNDKDSFWAVGADKKGAIDATVRYGVGTIEQSGYNGETISFKSDQEPSIIALKSSTAATRIGETVPIESPVRASKSNGLM